MTTRKRSRKVTSRIVLFAGLALILAACGGESDSGDSGTPATLDNTAWDLTELGEVEVFQGAPANIIFGSTDETGSGDSFGSTGCNSFSGAYETEGDTINIGPLITTLAGCNNPAVQPQEGRYLITLETAETYAILGDTLELANAGGEVTARFQVAGPDISLTSWVAISINNGTGGAQSVIPASDIVAVFDGIGLLNGFGGCNNYSSAYRVSDDYDVAEGGEIVFAGIAAAHKDCEADLQAQEDAYFAALENSRLYIIQGLNLELRDSAGATQVLFIRSMEG